MAQADYNVANQSGASFRADLNNQLAAIVSNNSGASEPSTTYAYQWWADTTTGTLKLRNAANSAWIEILQLDGEWTNIALENGTAAAPPLYFKDSGTDTGFFSPGTDALGFSTGGTERARIDSSGRLLVGKSGSPTADQGSVSRIVAQGYVGSDSNGAIISLQRGETAADITSGELLGRISFNDSAGYSFAMINAYADGTAGASDYPGTLVFSTTADGASSPTERMRITNAGNVGIGTSSPASLFHVRGSVAVATIEGTSTSSASIRFRTNNADRYKISTPDSSADLAFLENGVNEKMRLDSSGRLGIGTSSPVTQCTVYGSASAIQFQNTNTGSASGDGFYVGNYGGLSAQVWQYESDVILIGTNNTERIRINEYGNVIINATSGYAYPGVYLKAGSTSSAEYCFVSQDSAAQNIFLLRNNTYVESPGIYNLTTGSAANVHVASTGTLGRSVSSIKYKTDVETLEDSYADAILNIRPVWYRSIAGEDRRDWGHWGFIAEEVYEVDPRLTFIKTEEQVIDENGLPSGTVPLDEPEVEGVQYDRFVPHLVNLIKRQRDQIEALEARVAALEGA